MGTTPDDVWAVGGVGVIHYDGSLWSVDHESVRVSQLRRLNGIAGVGGQLWVVGSRGTILKHVQGHWTREVVPTDVELTSVWADKGGDVFAAGKAGTVLYYDGAAWSLMATNSEADLEGVWGSGPEDVFAVGLRGTILYYDGHVWTRMASGTEEDLHGISGASCADVVAVGRHGVALRFDGSRWSDTTTESVEDLRAIATSPDGVHVAVGTSGEALCSHAEPVTYTLQLEWTPSSPAEAELAASAAGKMIRLLERRAEAFGWPKPDVLPIGNDQFEVSFSGYVRFWEAEAMGTVLTRTGLLSVNWVAGAAAGPGQLPLSSDEHLVIQGRDGRFFALDRDPILAGGHLASATAAYAFDEGGMVTLHLTDVGRRALMQELRHGFPDQAIAVVLDDQVLCSWSVPACLVGALADTQIWFSLDPIIHGLASEEAWVIAAILEAGTFPLELRLLSGPSGSWP